MKHHVGTWIEGLVKADEGREETTIGDSRAQSEPGPRRVADAQHRPMGLAEGPDGALYLTDSSQGRIWRITYGR